MSRTYGSMKGAAMVLAMAVIVTLLASTLAIAGQANTTIGIQPINRNFTLASPTPIPGPSLSAGLRPNLTLVTATPTPPKSNLSFNYSLANKNFTLVPLSNNSTQPTSMVGYIVFDSVGYYVPEDGTLKVNVTRYGGVGNETFAITATSWMFNLSEIGWTNVTRTITAPGTYEVTLPINVSSDKGLAGKYFLIVLNACSPNCKVDEPDIATVSILDKNGPPARATVKLSAAAYESDSSGAAFVTVRRTGGSGAVWMKVSLGPVMPQNTPTPQPNSVQQAYYSETYYTYSGMPGENLYFAITNKYINGFMGYEFSAVGPAQPNGDVLFNISVSPLDDNFAELGVPSSAVVTIHHNGNATISPNNLKLNTSQSPGRSLGSILVSGSPDNPEVSSVTGPGAAMGPDSQAPGGESQGNPATDVHLNPQPEPPAPGFFDGIVNSIKSLFGFA